jgi:hypothetical protein
LTSGSSQPRRGSPEDLQRRRLRSSRLPGLPSVSSRRFPLTSPARRPRGSFGSRPPHPPWQSRRSHTRAAGKRHQIRTGAFHFGRSAAGARAAGAPVPRRHHRPRQPRRSSGTRPGARPATVAMAQRDGGNRRSVTLRRFPPRRRHCPPAASRDTTPGPPGRTARSPPGRTPFHRKRTRSAFMSPGAATDVLRTPRRRDQSHPAGHSRY